MHSQSAKRCSLCFCLFSPVPDGKPVVTSAHNASSTSIYVTWKAPPASTIHGEFLGYRLAYKQRDDNSGSDTLQEVFLSDSNTEVRPAIVNHFSSALITSPLHFRAT